LELFGFKAGTWPWSRERGLIWEEEADVRKKTDSSTKKNLRLLAIALPHQLSRYHE
jgi:hypothetical protein